MIRVLGHRNGGRSGGGTRQAIEGFSKSSRRSMLRRLGALDLSSVNGVPVVVTLTYPADWRASCPTGRQAKQQLLSFRRRWVRRWGSFSGVWKLEFQPRYKQPKKRQLAPHFHILAVIPGVPRRRPARPASSCRALPCLCVGPVWSCVSRRGHRHYEPGAWPSLRASCALPCAHRRALRQRLTPNKLRRPCRTGPLPGHGKRGGAGGNRTPVHQALNDRDTTIPALVLTQHCRRVDYPLRDRVSSFRHVSVLSSCQRSFLPSSFASVAGLR